MGTARLLRHGRRRHEADELEIGRARAHRLERGEQFARRGTAGAQKNPAPRPDRREGLLSAHKLRADVGGSLINQPAHPASLRALSKETERSHTPSPDIRRWLGHGNVREDCHYLLIVARLSPYSRPRRRTFRLVLRQPDPSSG